MSILRIQLYNELYMLSDCNITFKKYIYIFFQIVVSGGAYFETFKAFIVENIQSSLTNLNKPVDRNQ